MTWATFDDKYAHHKKLVVLSDSEWRLHTTALLECNFQLTDGFVAEGLVAHLPAAPRGKSLAKAIKTLEDNGLWERVDGGWMLHDFLDWNPTAEQVRENRRLARERMQRIRSGEQPPNVRANRPRTNAARSPHVHDPSPDPDPDRPDKGSSEGPDRSPAPETASPDTPPINRGKIADKFASTFDTEAPDQLEFTAEHLEFARLHHFRLEELWLKCRDKRRAKGYRCANWNAEFMAWMRQELEWERERAASRPKLSLDEERGREAAARSRKPTAEPRESAGAYSLVNSLVKTIPGPQRRQEPVTTDDIDAALEKLGARHAAP